ncbi:MAG: integrase core domain-containing protein [Proteobacteria bacterium]|nr:integrase core domain-containing protein [Pseudomonadota bacterium]
MCCSDWIGFYNQRQPHQALGMKTPAQTYQAWKIAA